jgi:hypothetical protein
VATGGAGGESGLGGESGSSGGVGDAAAAGGGAGAGAGWAGGFSGGARDAAAAGSGGAKDAASGLGGAGGSSGGAAAGAGGTAIPDAGASDAPAERPADTVPDTKALTPDTAAPTPRDGGAVPVLAGCGRMTTQRYFCDDFESGLDRWHYATEGWGLTNTTFQSANYSVTDSPNGNYPAGAQSEITMVSSVDLTGAVLPVVAFWHKLAIGGGNSYLDVSTDGGTTWTVVKTLTSADNTSVWSSQQVSLLSYLGKKAKLRFRLNAAGTGDGWYIDDVEIREAELLSTGAADAGSQSPVPVEPPTGCAGAPVPGRYFCEDFDTVDWSNNWQVATGGWNTVASTYQSGPLSVTDSPDGNYLSGAKSDLTMLSSVDLTGAVSPILTFWYKLALTCTPGWCVFNSPSYSDHVYVDVSSDSGTTWSQLWDLFNLNNTSTWTFQQLSLSAYAGKKIKLRFLLVDNGDGTQGDGWYIDDIKIREDEFVPASSDLALCTTQAAGGACNSADLCGKKCGPDLLGSKSLTCTAAKFVESVCAFPSGADYSCYKVGAAAACATGTKAGQACTATACQACGATTGTGYLDASGAAKQGFCVCSKGVWSCGTTAEWPCYPQTTGATVPASCN